MSALPRAEWEHHTAGMFMGERRRVSHVCGPGSPMMVSFDASGFRAWCFRCGVGGSLPRPQESLAEKLERLRSGQAADLVAASAELPLPVVDAGAIREWPIEARLWLYKAGLGGPEIARLGAYYHPPTNRVVLPVSGPSGGIPVYWQARSIDGRNPKYLGSPVGRNIALPRWGASGIIAVTEDILSAFKIGLAGGEAWCALGTRLSSTFIAAALAASRPMAVWLDPDPAGQVGASKIIKQLRAYGIAARTLVSTRDPKLHSKENIREYLESWRQRG